MQNIKVWVPHVREYGANKAIIMGAIHWMYFDKGHKTLRIERDGKKCWVCSVAQMVKETGLSKRQAGRALDSLVQDGVADRKVYRFAGSPTSYLRPNFPSLIKKVKKKQRKRKSGQPDRQR